MSVNDPKQAYDTFVNIYLDLHNRQYPTEKFWMTEKTTKKSMDDLRPTAKMSK